MFWLEEVIEDDRFKLSNIRYIVEKFFHGTTVYSKLQKLIFAPSSVLSFLCQNCEDSMAFLKVKNALISGHQPSPYRIPELFDYGV